ncbi:hypothetical protein KBTX_03950 [wastewater metagenome]|uniref:Uncharacterized protein n=2 Tax=unclassified sequences TaxID=12908 RepID=A0A5B8RIQ5_9ZZZZ|nr:hypothetical protein KBTEX_03950 [uncultured organism]
MPVDDETGIGGDIHRGVTAQGKGTADLPVTEGQGIRAGQPGVAAAVGAQGTVHAGEADVDGRPRPADRAVGLERHRLAADVEIGDRAVEIAVRGVEVDAAVHDHAADAEVAVEPLQRHVPGGGDTAERPRDIQRQRGPVGIADRAIGGPEGNVAADGDRARRAVGHGDAVVGQEPGVIAHVDGPDTDVAERLDIGGAAGGDVEAASGVHVHGDGLVHDQGGDIAVIVVLDGHVTGCPRGAQGTDLLVGEAAVEQVLVIDAHGIGDLADAPAGLQGDVAAADVRGLVHGAAPARLQRNHVDGTAQLVVGPRGTVGELRDLAVGGLVVVIRLEGLEGAR